MQKRKYSLKQIRKDNRGSGMVLVLVTMLFISLLASSILYMTLIGYQMRAAERTAEGEFYSAEKAMDEIRAGVEDAVSDSIAEAYSTVLTNYNNTAFLSGYADMSEAFQKDFVDHLKVWKKTVTIGGHDYTVKLFTSSSAYNPDVLQSYVSSENAVVSRTGNTWTYSDTEKTLTIHNVEVTYTGKNDYVTTVKADIVIGMPDFTYVNSTYSATGLQEFALIANQSLNQTTVSRLTINGSSYAGSMNLDGAGATLTFRNGSAVIANEVKVNGATGGNGASAPSSAGDSRLMTESDASVWAGRISVGTSSSVKLQGETYVYDDLDLEGKNSVAWLSDSYYGFGNSVTEADKSSAILADGRNTILDLSQLSRLMLAGHSFISNSFTSSDTATDSTMMGESISVRQDQLAYLVPVEYFASITSNPMVITAGYTRDTSLSEAGAAAQNIYKFEVKTITAKIPGAGQDADYYFMTFPNAEDANKFFAAYFADHESDIEQYLENYTTLTVNQHASYQTAGYFLSKDTSAGTYSLGRYVTADSMKNSAQQLQDTFAQLKQTLFVTDSSVAKNDTSVNPYNYFVKTSAVNALTANTVNYFAAEGTSDALAAVINNPGASVKVSDIVDGHDQICLIIASGSIQVDQDFTGLIISGADINLYKNVTADSDRVKIAMTAVNGTDSIANYMRDGVTDSVSSDTHTSTSGWNMSELVTYNSWTKN